MVPHIHGFLKVICCFSKTAVCTSPLRSHIDFISKQREPPLSQMRSFCAYQRITSFSFSFFIGFVLAELFSSRVEWVGWERTKCSNRWKSGWVSEVMSHCLLKACFFTDLIRPCVRFCVWKCNATVYKKKITNFLLSHLPKVYFQLMTQISKARKKLNIR